MYLRPASWAWATQACRLSRWRTLARPATFDQVPAATAPAPDTPVIVGDPPTC